MRLIPAWLLRKLYTRQSLRNVHHGWAFSLKNRLSEGKLTRIHELRLDGQVLDLQRVKLTTETDSVSAPAISVDRPLHFDMGSALHLYVEAGPLVPGLYQLQLSVDSEPFGHLQLEFEDSLEAAVDDCRIPRDRDDDYSASIIATRRAFLEKHCGRRPQHLYHASYDPHLCKGNLEHYLGVAQVPLGIAGPLKVRGEHAQGDFLVPMATTEGTLVASYNRGMKLVQASGGALCTVVGDQMQRAPVFVFDDARGGRRFVDWVVAQLELIRQAAEATSSVAHLKHIDYYLSNRFAYLRFNFTTGDAAGQNMVGRATLAACNWILQHYEPNQIQRFFLESNFATDKKASMINSMRTRGKRVTAEATVPRQVLREQMGVEPEQLAYHYGVANVGAFLAGANNNGLHSANALAALFIATGQDVANLAESSAALVYAEVTESKDLYFSITLPSLIVATHGGGTGLPTQRECLELLDCWGSGKVLKLAEIVAATVLAGELSLASAISAMDWVAAHEALGRNR